MNRTPASYALFEDYRRRCLWHGIALCTLGFVSALFIPLYANPRTGLAAHLVGITSGLLLAAAGMTFPLLRFSRLLAALTFWLLAVSLYAGFVGELLGAIFGLTRVFVITAQGRAAGPIFWEALVESIIKTITPTTILPCLFIMYGLRRPGVSASQCENAHETETAQHAQTVGSR